MIENISFITLIARVVCISELLDASTEERMRDNTFSLESAIVLECA